LILGASVRAAAASARRAGWSPVCGDLFADRDLADIAAAVHRAAVHRADSMPQLASVAERYPNIPCLFAGGMENLDEKTLRMIVRDRPGFTPPIPAIARSRDPWFLQQAVRAVGLPTAELRPGDATPPEGDWLWKPLRGSAGFHIRRMDVSRKRGTAGGLKPIGSSGYLQAFIAGTPASAVCLGLPDDRGGLSAVVLGVCRQELSGERVPGRPFGFAGAITPYPGRVDMRCVERLAETVAAACGLTGLFGIDFIVDEATGAATLIEVNPRYTATVELMECRLRRPLLAWHEAAFQSTSASDSGSLRTGSLRTGSLRGEVERARQAIDAGSSLPGRTQYFAKRIVFARSGQQVNDPSRFDRAIQEAKSAAGTWSLPSVADLPRNGIAFHAGDPICTLMSQGESVEETATILDCQERIVRQAMGETSPGNHAKQ
jgi:predicted ATP-grasp superfamily ATP-dependent carboligase